MGKTVKRRRTNASKVLPVSELGNPLPALDGGEEDLIGGLVLPDELQITIETLTLLSDHPEVLKSKVFKGLKTAVWDFQNRWSDASGAGTSLVSRISHALTDARYTDALVLLSELRIRKQQPKLGTLQRWVRECDAASLRDGEIVWEVLEAILRATTVEAGMQVRKDRASVVRRREEWVVRDKSGIDLLDELQTGELLGPDPSIFRHPFLPLLTTLGPLRKPPNLHASTIYHSPSNPVRLSDTPSSQIARHDHPVIPGVFMLTDVLSRPEARAIVQAAEAVGLDPDQPAGGSAVEMTSVLAHNMIWLVNPEFHDTLFDRVKHLLPPTMHGGPVRGINKRFRIYRYRPGALYRPHIDGAWPASALSNTSPPEYVYDSDPSLYSRLTLLIYLNDGFEGGWTTFFVPSPDSQGMLDALPVRPVMGAATVFPHGDTKGSLLHEGSGVIEGAKYVIRTEVLYEVGKAGRGE